MEATLIGLAEGDSGVIGDIDVRVGSRGRLMDLGLTPGARVSCLFSAPSGDPRAYLIRGSVIALRREDAAGVRLMGR